jgi:hypothetical protein
MHAPLRLYTADRSAVGLPAGPIDPWLTRLVKLVPAEIVAVYLAGRPLAQARYAGLWPVACLVLAIVVRAFGTSDRRGPQWLSVRGLGGVVRALGRTPRAGTSSRSWSTPTSRRWPCSVWTTLVAGVLAWGSLSLGPHEQRFFLTRRAQRVLAFPQAICHRPPAAGGSHASSYPPRARLHPTRIVHRAASPRPRARGIGKRRAWIPDTARPHPALARRRSTIPPAIRWSCSVARGSTSGAGTTFNQCTRLALSGAACGSPSRSPVRCRPGVSPHDDLRSRARPHAGVRWRRPCVGP